MSNRPDEHCRLCPAWRLAKTICVRGRSSEGLKYPDGPVDVLFVTSSPSLDDDRTGTVLTGDDGRMFDEFTKHMLKGVSWYAVPAVRCFCGFTNAGKVRKPLKANALACLPYLDADIEKLQPKVIVPMGPQAIASVFGMKIGDVKVKQFVGHIRMTEHGVPGVAVHAPAFVTMNPSSGIPIWRSEWNQILQALSGEEAGRPEGDWEWLESKEKQEAWYNETKALIKKNPAKGILTLDYETTGFDPRTSNFRMVGYTLDGKKAVVMPLYEKWQQELHRKFIYGTRSMHPWRLNVHHQLFELEWMYVKFGALPPQEVVDTKALAFLHDENQSMKLDALTARYVPEYAGLKWASEGQDEDLFEIADAVLAERCAFDVLTTHRLSEILEKEIGREKKDLYDKIIGPSMGTVAKTKARGWRVNRDHLGEMAQEIHAEFVDVSEQIQEHPDVIAWCEQKRQELGTIKRPELNINSAIQKAQLLASLGIKPRDKYEAMSHHHPGLIATKKLVLETLKDRHPLIPLFLKYNDLKHKLDHFLDKIWKDSARDGRIYPGYNWGGQVRADQAKGTVTARLSAVPSYPLNPPKQIREVFVGHEPGWLVIGADYKALEMRLAAVGCPEPVWEKAFREGHDPHQATADAMGADRPTAKNQNYGKMYGQGVAAFARKMGISFEKAAGFDEAWRRANKGFCLFDKKKRLEAMERGCVAGFFAQERHLPDIFSDDDKRQAHALNQAGNFPYQNAAGYITLLAEYLVDNALESGILRGVVMGQMHDAIYVSCPREELEETKALIRKCMVDEVHRRVPWLNGILDIDFTTGVSMAGSKVLGASDD